MTRSNARSGLSLVEVLIALAVLAIGIVALANLQASSLRFTSTAEELRTVTQIAEAELEWRRQTEIQPLSTDCESTVPNGFECTVAIVPVGALGNDISVTVTSRNADITLSAFTTGQRYISGQMPDIVGIIDDGTGGDTGGGTGGETGGGETGGGTGGETGGGTVTPDPPPTPCVNPGKGKGKNAC